ncbi:MAG TPA: DNA polymerase III subunit delta' [Proteobacteria bacterium]|nr:DNA polymerase III subunit delta' [Pseudomonadota bacterium]
MLFDRIKGQESAVRILARALESGRMPTTFLFTGPSGCGRMGTALALAASFNCENSALACGSCQSCRLHISNSHPDLVIVRPPEGKRVIVIEQIRTLIERAYLMPLMGTTSTFIVDGAHLMNPNAANALLKTLEEPPATSRFILIAPDRDSVLPTVSSRCRILAFRPLSRSVMEALLEAEGIDKKRAALLASMARGSMARGLEYHREEIPERMAQEFGPLSSLHEAGPGRLLDLAKGWGKNRTEALKITGLMAQWYRDILVLSEGAPREQLIHSSHLATLRTLAEELGSASLSMILESIEDAREDLENNTNVELTMDNLLFRLRKFGRTGQGNTLSREGF